MRTMIRVVSALGLLAAAATAQQVGKAEDVQSQISNLTRLVEKQQAQIEALEKSQAALLEELRKTRTAEPVPVAPSRVDLSAESAEAAPKQDQAPALQDQIAAYSGPREGRIQLGDKVRIGGYGSVRFEVNDVASGNNIPGGSAGSFTFRRFVVTTDARPAPRLRVYSEIEFERLHSLEAEKQFGRTPDSIAFKQTTEGNAGGELSVEQAWGQFDFTKNLSLRGGVVLVPVGRYNLLHDDDYWDIPRRTLTDRDAPVLPVKAAWRDLGAGLLGKFDVGEKGRLDYQVYVLNGAALDFNLEQQVSTTAGAPGSAELRLNSELKLASGFFDGSKSASAVAWRIAYSPIINGEFGLSGYHGKYAPPFLSFRESVNSFAYDQKWRYKGFETEAEAVYTTLGRLPLVIQNFAHAVFNTESITGGSSSGGGITSATVEMELAGLARTRVGIWSDFKYHARPQWLKRSFLGRSFEDPQIIPIVRYERVWLNGVADGITASGFGNTVQTSYTSEDLGQDRWTAGISYRPNQQFALQAAYEHNRRITGSRLIFPAVPQDSTNGLILGMSFAF